MQNMSSYDRREMEIEIGYIFGHSIGNEAARTILSHEVPRTNGTTLMDEVIRDIVETSEWAFNGNYNNDDIRLAIGRVLMKNLGIEC